MLTIWTALKQIKYVAVNSGKSFELLHQWAWKFNPFPLFGCYHGDVALTVHCTIVNVKTFFLPICALTCSDVPNEQFSVPRSCLYNPSVQWEEFRIEICEDAMPIWVHHTEVSVVYSPTLASSSETTLVTFAKSNDVLQETSFQPIFKPRTTLHKEYRKGNS